MHGLFGRELQSIGGGLLQTGRSEWSRRRGAAFRFLAVNDFQGAERRRFFGQSFIKQVLLPVFNPRFDLPDGLPAVRDVVHIFKGQLRTVMGCAAKILYFPLALHNQAHSRALHPASGEFFTGSIGERPADHVAAEAIQNPPTFLRGNQGHVDGTRHIKRGLDGFFGDFRIGDALGVFELQSVLQVPGYCLTLTIRVCGKVDGFSIFDEPGQTGEDILAPIRGNIFGLEVRGGHPPFP